ncbi:MAG: uracil-DNA glycosylase [Candidatus Berkelbacteria bacterium]|nr:uracil-DNA glycosylase [Candidatus Berkelbacteria bacterium]
MDEKGQKLIEIAEEISECKKCSLSETRTKTVPGTGDAEAEIFFVGEAPGFNEDQKGIPFCGAAGKFLDELLKTIGLDRQKVFIANTLKCRPPENRDPEESEKDLCRHFLLEQIEVINPKIIVTLGKHSTETFLPGLGGITKLRAKLYRRPNGRYFFPLYHPAAALHNGSLRQTLEIDFGKLPAAVEKVKTELAKIEKENVKQEKLF